MRHITKIAYVLAAAFALSQQAAKSQILTTTVSFDSGSVMLYSNAAKTTPLTAGSTTNVVDGDGAVLQLGYYSAATTSNFFAGTFIPLSGPGSSDTYTTTSVGDANAAGAGPGTFALTLTFSLNNDGTPTATGKNLPAAGVPLAIVFYNNTTIASSTAYNAVSDSLWTFKSPNSPAPTVAISLDDANLQFLGGAGSALYTSQAVVPEPSSLMSGGLVCLGFIWIARRRKSAVVA